MNAQRRRSARPDDPRAGAAAREGAGSEADLRRHLGAQAGRAAIRVADGLVNAVVLVVTVVLVALSCYVVWDSVQVNDAAQPSRYELYKPTAPGAGAGLGGAAALAQLQAINPDVMAWLSVYDTAIDYPVVQGDDNQHYLKTDATGAYSAPGAIFVDYRNSSDFSDFSTIVYGHHLKNGGMFGQLHLFGDEDFFDAHRHGALWVGGRQRGLEFFAFVHTSAYDDSVYTAPVAPNAERAYLETLRREAMFFRPDVAVGPQDHIVLLSTCSNRTTNGRDILVGVLTDHVADDPSAAVGGGAFRMPMVDQVSGWWAQAPWWVKTGVVGVSVWAILLVALLARRRRPRGARFVDARH